MIAALMKHGFAPFIPFAVVSSLLLGACGGSSAPASGAASPSRTLSASGASSTGAVASGKPAAASALPASVPASPGSSNSAAAGSSGSIKIRYLVPLTGPLANIGQDNEDGFKLGLATFNSTVGGRKIEVLDADTQGKADVALTKSKQLVESDKAQVLMGLNTTPECYAVAPYVKEAQVPLIISTNCSAQKEAIDPKYASQWLARTTQTSMQTGDPLADWAYKQGYRKGILVAADFGGGIESTDAFAAGFIRRGGTIIQELYPPLGNNDYGPYIAQLNQSADFIVGALFGIDGLKFAQQLATYSGQKKLPVLDISSGITAGPNRQQLGDKAVGITAEYSWSTGVDNPSNAAFIKGWRAKNPDRYVSKDAANGFAAAQVLEAAIKKVNGNVEDKQAFAQAIASTNLETNKGPLKLNQDHDVVQNMYVFQMTKNGSLVDDKIVETYKDVPPEGIGWTRQQMEKFPIGSMKGKWVGMTKDALAQVTG